MRSASLTVLVITGLSVVSLGCGGTTSQAEAKRTNTAVHSEAAGATAGQEGSSADAAPSTPAPSTVAPPSRLDIVATEYNWSGLPDRLPAGSYPVSFRNDGIEFHEVSIFRNPQKLPLEKLFELGPQGIKGSVEMVGTLLSGPGTAADHELTVTLTPGEYQVVCFVPATSDGEAHFKHGMHRILTVSAAP